MKVAAIFVLAMLMPAVYAADRKECESKAEGQIRSLVGESTGQAQHSYADLYNKFAKCVEAGICQKFEITIGAAEVMVDETFVNIQREKLKSMRAFWAEAQKLKDDPCGLVERLPFYEAQIRGLNEAQMRRSMELFNKMLPQSQ